MGTKVELCPNFDPDSVFKNVGKFTIAFAAPFHYRYLKDNINKLTDKQKKQFEKVECLRSVWRYQPGARCFPAFCRICFEQYGPREV